MPTVTNLTITGSPSASNQAVTKAYVDASTEALNIHPAVNLFADATNNTILLSYIYINGVADTNGGLGIGARLVDSTLGTTLVIDGVSVALNNRILVNTFSGASGLANGIYYVSQVGYPGPVPPQQPWMLTRATDSDNSVVGQVVRGDATFVSQGASYVGTTWIQTDNGTGNPPPNSIKLGTDPMTWVQFGGVSAVPILDDHASPTFPINFTKGIWYGSFTKENAFDTTSITFGDNAATQASNAIAVGNNSIAGVVNSLSIGYGAVARAFVVGTSAGLALTIPSDSVNSVIPPAATQYLYMMVNGVQYGIPLGSFNPANTTLSSGGIWVGNGSNKATTVNISGDATISNTGVLTLTSVGTPGTYGSSNQVPVITTDSKGRVISVTDTTISGTSPVGSSLPSGDIWVGNASNTAAVVAMSGDATISNTGVLALANVGTPGTYGSANQVAVITTDSKGRVTSVTNTMISSVSPVGSTLPSGDIWVGNAINEASAVTMSGDVSVSNTGSTYINALQGNTLTAPTPNNYDILSFIGSSWVNTSTPQLSTLTLTGSIVSSSQAATKAYVDAATSGLNIHPAVLVYADASSMVVTASTYTNGTAGYGGAAASGLGVGATLTDSTAGRTLVIDGVTLALNNRVLVNGFSGASEPYNDIYYVSQLGYPGPAPPQQQWVLTRATDSDNHLPGQVSPGDNTFVQEGTLYAGTGWTQYLSGTGTPTGTIVLGTNPISWTQTAGPGANVTSFSAGATGFTPSSPTTGAVVLSGTLNTASGGTGLSSIGTSNQILGVNAGASALEYKSLVSGTGISIVNTTGQVSIAASSISPSSISLTNNHIFVGNASNVAANVAMSGDVNITNTGATTVVSVDLLPISATTGANSSIYFGYTSMVPSGVQNIGIGYQALNVATGGQNTVVGNGAGILITTGSGNTLLGCGASVGATNNNTVVIGQGSSTVSNGDTIVGQGITSLADDAVIMGRGASVGASGGQSVVVGQGAASNISRGLVVGQGATVVDAAHAIGFGVNASSVSPGTLGMTVNSAGYQLPLYSSLFASTVTSAGITTLTSTSAQTQVFTGTATQTIVLPAVSSLSDNFTFTFINESTSALTINSSTFMVVATISSGVRNDITCIDNTGSQGIDGWYVASFFSTTAVVLDSSATPTYPTNLTSGVWYGLNTKANSFDATCVTMGKNAATQATNCVSVGDGAISSVLNSTTLGAGATVAGTANALGFGVNQSSINANSLGVTVNGVTGQATVYPNLQNTVSTSSVPLLLSFTGAAAAQTQYLTGTSSQYVMLPPVPNANTSVTLLNGYIMNIINASTATANIVTSSTTLIQAVTLPTTPILVTSVASFPSVGTAYLNTTTSNGVQAISYTGTNTVTTTSTATPQTLPPGGGLFNVANASGLLAAGAVYVQTGVSAPYSYQIVNYTSIVGNVLHGCTGGTGTTTANGSVVQAVITGATLGTGSAAVGAAIGIFVETIAMGLQSNITCVDNTGVGGSGGWYTSVIESGGASSVNLASVPALNYPNNYYASLAGVLVGGLYRSNFNLAINPVTSGVSIVFGTPATTATITVTGTPLIVGTLLTGSANIQQGTYITSQVSGTTGGTGVYNVTTPIVANSAGATVTGAGYILMTNPDILYVRTV
jgi:hypothetical protein